MRSETVKLIIEISKDYYEILKSEVEQNLTDYYPFIVIGNGTPLDSNSERAEVQAYFDGQAYGWEEGRKALIEDIKAEIKEKAFTEEIFDEEIFKSTYTENVTRETAEEESVIETEIVKLSDILEIIEKNMKGENNA